MLTLENISLRLGNFELKNISFIVEENEYFIILGESGVGKSVLLEAIVGLIKPQTGKIILKDKDISNYPIQKRKLGLVYQDQALFPHLSVQDNISYALKAKREKNAEIAKKVAEIAKILGVEGMLTRYPNTLSLGEAQRVALARTLISKPDILLLDEPLASLDIQAKQNIRSLLRKINSAGQTIIHVTHDYEEAIALASKIAILENNSISQIGKPDKIFRHPKSEFIANFVGIKNFYKGRTTQINTKLSKFKVDNVNELDFFIATEEKGCNSNLIVRSEDITIFKTLPESSAKNHFQGYIKDIEPAKNGIEVIVDIKVPIAILITKESLTQLNLKIGNKVFVSFKATAPKLITLD